MEDNLTEKSIEQKQGVPWEQRKEKGLLKALWQTTKEVLFHPKKFFDKLVGVESLSDAFWFYVAMNIASFFVGMGVFILTNYLTLKSFFSLLKSFPFFIFIVPIVFIIICVGIYISAAIMHLFVLLFKGEGGYGGTFNVMAYSYAAELWFLLLMAVGNIINLILVNLLRTNMIVFIIPIVFLTGLVWIMVIPIIGYSRIHGFGFIRAICAFLFPIIIFSFFYHTTNIKEKEKAPGGSREATESLEDSLKKLEQARIVVRERIAKANCAEINAACKHYFTNKGRYPSSLKDLLSLARSPYESSNLAIFAKANSPSFSNQGCYYVYESSDGNHFTLYAKPANPRKGDRVFFIDETGILRLEGPNGAPIEQKSKN